MKRKSVVFLLIFALLGAMCVPAAAADSTSHMELSLSELEQMSFSLEEFQSLASEISSLGQDHANLDAVAEKLDKLKQLYELADTETTLSSIRTSQDVTDQAENERYLSLIERGDEINTTLNHLIPALLAGPCADAVDQDDPVFSMFLTETDDPTDGEQSLTYAEQSLIDKYNDRAQDSYTAEVGGETYTEDEVYSAYLAGDLGWDEYDSAEQEIAKAQNDALAGIYVELVKNRNRQAEMYGFDSYPEMEDSWVYLRDYSEADIETFSGAVKTYIVPLANELWNQMSDYSLSGSYDTVFTGDELLQNLRSGLGNLSSEFLPALDYMTKYGYYDIAASDTKSDGAYTTILTYPNAPFLLMKPVGDGTDFTALVHEFGHYNAYFGSRDVFAANYDLSEIHSQGLELLMLSQYDDVFGDRADAERLSTVEQVLTAMVDGCMMDELERYAYGEKDLSVEKLNRKYMELLRDYGYRDETDEASEAYDWVLTSHLYSEPLYYISYGVSASAAFSLFEQAQTDQDGAVNTYLQLTELGETGDFLPTLQTVGIDSPLTEAYVEDLAAALGGYFDAGAETAGSSAEPERTAWDGAAAAVKIAAIVFVALDVLTVLLLVIYRKGKKRHDQTGN